jgi:hypothetical protein
MNLTLLFNPPTPITGYQDRNFGSEHLLNVNFNSFNKYQHIKIKARNNKKNYLMFDIDNIDIQKVDLLFNNDFIKPNFYIYEYSKKKKCYTLQVFLLFNNEIIINDKLIEKYKKLCLLFGADTQYQIKTGIHKNPDFYSKITVDIDNIQMEKSDHTGFIHNNKYDNFNNLYNNFEFCGYFENLHEEQKNIEVKIKHVEEVKTKKSIKKNKENGTRNITLFNETRLIAYSISDKSYDNILHIANKINNNFSNPLNKSEVNKTVKSIYKFINVEFSTKRVDPYSDNQRAKSIKTRSTNALVKVVDAIVKLLDNNKNITASAIKKLSNQKIETIKKCIDKATVIANDICKNTKQQRVAIEFAKSSTVPSKKPQKPKTQKPKFYETNYLEKKYLINKNSNSLL